MDKKLHFNRELKFDDVQLRYYEKFGRFPPILTTLDRENQEYLQMLLKAIEKGKELNMNDLDKFMPDMGKKGICY